jgi:hypothetical protein
MSSTYSFYSTGSETNNHHRKPSGISEAERDFEFHKGVDASFMSPAVQDVKDLIDGMNAHIPNPRERFDFKFDRAPSYMRDREHFSRAITITGPQPAELGAKRDTFRLETKSYIGGRSKPDESAQVAVTIDNHAREGRKAKSGTYYLFGGPTPAHYAPLGKDNAIGSSAPGQSLGDIKAGTYGLMGDWLKGQNAAAFNAYFRVEPATPGPQGQSPEFAAAPA